MPEDDTQEYIDMLVQAIVERIDEMKYADEKKGKTRTGKQYVLKAMASLNEEWGGMALNIVKEGRKKKAHDIRTEMYTSRD